MRSETNQIVDEMMEIFRARGDDLNQLDLEELEILSMKIATDDLHEVWPMVMESVTLTVSSPTYQGNIVL